MSYLVRESFPQAGFDTDTQRHSWIQAASPEEAMEVVRNYTQVINGIKYGCVPGSKLSVICQRDFRASR
jgi:hypothetical protein